MCVCHKCLVRFHIYQSGRGRRWGRYFLNFSLFSVCLISTFDKIYIFHSLIFHIRRLKSLWLCCCHLGDVPKPQKSLVRGGEGREKKREDKKKTQSYLSFLVFLSKAIFMFIGSELIPSLKSLIDAMFTRLPNSLFFVGDGDSND